MSRQIVIGKEGNQPFAIQDPKVSRRHAYLNIGDGGQLQLIDNQSTNGTYIYNGSVFVRLYANQPYNVQPDSMIQLGPDTRFHVRRLLSPAVNAQPAAAAAPKPQPQPKKEAPKPKKVDISSLRRISDRYNATKMEIETKTGTINGLRSCTILVSMLAGVGAKMFSPDLGFGENSEMIGILLSVLLAGVLMAILLLIINNFNKKLIKRRNDNEHDYAVKYCCPECGVSFRGKIYENILSERRCPRCKSEYYEKNPKA